ncbi:MAG: hypothetical protein J0M29_00745 [Chitinophagales bacterium]|nr:hypothetical protein [Chitinophagales bacterium]
MIRLSLLALTLTSLLWTACQSDKPKFTSSSSQIQLVTDNNPRWVYENLRLYPVTADASLISENQSLAQLKTLAEGMHTPGFRLLEHKQFGKQEDNWFHALTVQNKSQDTILMLSGDVVKGGNQDRVIAHHEVIMPMTVRNIEVYCVETGRSTYYDPQASPAEKDIAAFKGYYNVASPSVRRAVHQSQNQQEVWNAVATVTKENDANSATSAYTALDAETESKKRRDAYFTHLKEAFTDRQDVVGMVAVAGGEVLGVDIFGSPELFRKEMGALLHGYIAESAAKTHAEVASEEQVRTAYNRVAKLSAVHAKATDGIGKFSWNGHWVHLFGQ